MKKIALLSLLLTAGCLSVPSTIVGINPKTHQLEVKSPKDVKIGALHAEIATNGTVSITISNYASANNVEVVQAVMDANSKINESVNQTLNNVISSGFNKAVVP